MLVCSFHGLLPHRNAFTCKVHHTKTPVVYEPKPWVEFEPMTLLLKGIKIKRLWKCGDCVMDTKF